MAFGQLAIDLDQLQADELQATLLEAGQDPPDEQALDAVGLDEDEGAFGHRVTILSVGVLARQG